jgi:hypothetical protein
MLPEVNWSSRKSFRVKGEYFEGQRRIITNVGENSQVSLILEHPL